MQMNWKLLITNCRIFDLPALNIHPGSTREKRINPINSCFSSIPLKLINSRTGFSCSSILGISSLTGLSLHLVWSLSSKADPPVLCNDLNLNYFYSQKSNTHRKIFLSSHTLLQVRNGFMNTAWHVESPLSDKIFIPALSPSLTPLGDDPST